MREKCNNKKPKKKRQKKKGKKKGQKKGQKKKGKKKSKEPESEIATKNLPLSFSLSSFVSLLHKQIFVQFANTVRVSTLKNNDLLSF